MYFHLCFARKLLLTWAAGLCSWTLPWRRSCPVAAHLHCSTVKGFTGCMVTGVSAAFVLFTIHWNVAQFWPGFSHGSGISPIVRVGTWSFPVQVGGWSILPAGCWVWACLLALLLGEVALSVSVQSGGKAWLPTPKVTADTARVMQVEQLFLYWILGFVQRGRLQQKTFHIS